MSEKMLFKNLVKLAYRNPGPVRDALMPILKGATDKSGAVQREASSGMEVQVLDADDQSFMWEGSLDELLADNEDLDDGDIAAIHKLRRGELYLVGGGAGAAFYIRRTR